MAKNYEYLLKHVHNKPVYMFEKEKWYELLRSDGGVTELKDDKPFENEKLNACMIATMASGICNPDPGIDVLRYDQNDEPYVINVDHYTVVENIYNHNKYPDLVEAAKIEDNDKLKNELEKYVYIIKEPPGKNHHLDDFPEFIEKSKFKE